jgi:hypothetical protein
VRQAKSRFKKLLEMRLIAGIAAMNHQGLGFTACAVRGSVIQGWRHVSVCAVWNVFHHWAVRRHAAVGLMYAQLLEQRRNIEPQRLKLL